MVHGLVSGLGFSKGKARQPSPPKTPAINIIGLKYGGQVFAFKVCGFGFRVWGTLGL